MPLVLMEISSDVVINAPLAQAWTILSAPAAMEQVYYYKEHALGVQIPMH